MRNRLAVLPAVLALSMLAGARSVEAQDYRGDLFLGYSFLGNDSLAVNAGSLPWGWAGGGAVRLNEWVSISFDVSGQYRFSFEPCGFDTPQLGDAACLAAEGVERPAPTVEFQGLSFHRTEEEWCSPTLRDAVGCSVRLGSVSGLGGPRIQFPSGRVRPFVQVLVGLVRSTRSIDFFTHTAVNLALAPGGGVDFDVSDNVSLRFQGDFRRVMFPSPDDSNSSLVSREDYNEFRFMIGAVFDVGLR